jgi:hypothetical protein
MGSSSLKQHRQFFSISCWTQDLHPITDSKEPGFLSNKEKTAFNTMGEDHLRIRRMIFDGCPCSIVAMASIVPEGACGLSRSVTQGTERMQDMALMPTGFINECNPEQVGKTVPCRIAMPYPAAG